MKRYFTSFAAVAALALSANAQQITISSIDQQLANDYAGGCEIDLNNDGLKEIIFSGQPNWGAAGKTIIEDAEGSGHHFQIARRSHYNRDFHDL